MLNRIVLRAVRRIVRQPNLHLNPGRQLLQMVFEHVSTRRITAAPIAQNQNRSRVRIRLSPIVFPPMTDAVAGEETRVVARSQVDVADVSDGIVEAVRINYALGRCRKVVIQSDDRLLSVQSPRAKQIADKLLLFSVDTDDGIARVFVFSPPLRDLAELLFALRMTLGGQLFLGLASAEMMPSEQGGYRGEGNPETVEDEFRTQVAKGKVGPTHAWPHRIACGVIANNLQKRGIQIGENTSQRSPSTPFFRDRPDGKSETAIRSRFPRRIVFSSQPRI